MDQTIFVFAWTGYIWLHLVLATFVGLLLYNVVLTIKEKLVGFYTHFEERVRKSALHFILSGITVLVLVWYHFNIMEYL